MAMGERAIVTRRGRALELAAACLGLLVSLWWACPPAAAQEAGSCAPSPASLNNAGWDIRQQPIVEVVVDVRTADDAALLAQLGHACPLGPCALELPAGAEQDLAALGLPVEITARAIKVTGAPKAEQYVIGATITDVPIPDATATGCGSMVRSDIVINSAPAGATVTKVKYWLRIPHDYVHDLLVRLGLGPGTPLVTLWNRAGGWTDDGLDDDAADDADIELSGREILAALDGRPVNATWSLFAQDCELHPHFGRGSIDQWMIWLYYDCAPLVPGTPASPFPADGAANQPLLLDLDWADAARAATYDVYLGVLPPPIQPLPLLGSAVNSRMLGARLMCGTHYYWQVAAKNDCGETRGPVWDFTTVCCLPGTPASPSPADGAANQPLLRTLDWADAAHATSYDVYLGVLPPPILPLPYLGTASGSRMPDVQLLCGAHYYWQVVAKSSCGETPGPVWDFTTVCCLPAAPTGPTPAAGATNRSLDVDLNWADADRATSYDVHFGTSASPPLVGNAASSAWPLPPLSANTRYYWKIVSRNTCGDAPGPVWTFTTRAAVVPRKAVQLPLLLRLDSP